MKLKRTIIVTFMLLAILAAGAVSAENQSAADLAIDEAGNESSIDSSAQESNHVSMHYMDTALESGGEEIPEDKEFAYLQSLIDTADEGGVIDLEGTYIGAGGEMKINKRLTINGNGAILDAKGMSRAFTITGNNVTIQNVTFANCKYNDRYNNAWGGAIIWSGAYGTLKDCTFINCTASTSGNDRDARGGAVYLSGTIPSISGCSFTNCTAKNDYTNLYYHARGTSSYGGAICIDSGADHATVADCIFENTLSYASSYSQDIRGWSADTTSYSYGGAIFWNGAYGSLKNSNFTNSLAETSSISEYSTVSCDSSAYSYGGAIYWEGSNGIVDGCRFLNTSAKSGAVTTYGGGNFASSSYSYGGAIYVKGTSKQVSKSTFEDCHADARSGYASSGIDWSVSGTSSTYSTTTEGAAICDKDAGATVNDCSFKDCSCNGDYKSVISNVKSVSGSTVSPKISTGISASKVTATYGVSKKFTATLKDASGSPVKSASVTVKVGSISKTLTTNDRGEVSVDISGLTPKTYTATISFGGNGIYKASSATASVTVKKATPKLTAKAKTFKKSVKTKKYTITLKDNINRAIKNAKVTIKVNKKTYTAKTDAKGKATFKIKNLKKKGTFKSTVTYKGDGCYSKATKKVKIKVK